MISALSDEPLKTLEACWQKIETLTPGNRSIKQVEFLEMRLLKMQYPLSELRGVVAQIIAAQKRTQFQYDKAQSKAYDEKVQLLLAILNQLGTSKDTLSHQLLTWETRISELKMKIYTVRI